VIALKLATITCIFFLAMVFLLEIAFFGLGRLRNGFMYFASPLGWGIVFSLLWLASFSLAWRILSASLRGRVPH